MEGDEERLNVTRRPEAAPQRPWPLGTRNEVRTGLTDIESRDERR